MFLLLIISSSGAETVHRWVDEKGRVHFGDRPPAMVESEIQHIESGSAENTLDSGAAAEIEDALQEIGEARRERDAARKKARREKRRATQQQTVDQDVEAASAEEEARQERLREQTGTYATPPAKVPDGD